MTVILSKRVSSLRGPCLKGEVIIFDKEVYAAKCTKSKRRKINNFFVKNFGLEFSTLNSNGCHLDIYIFQVKTSLQSSDERIKKLILTPPVSVYNRLNT